MQNDAAAAPTVAAVRTATRDVLLAPEADGAGSAGPGLRADGGFVEEHGG